MMRQASGRSREIGAEQVMELINRSLQQAPGGARHGRQDGDLDRHCPARVVGTRNPVAPRTRSQDIE